ncbi:hypothetical protein HPB52_001968 [Rhipicephalus sanguineus]|uniref:CCHC-type domain-containing protein n=1 Tax=Rhipicephalus sanguineus TaxID=34632 RepID=A0A9D4PBN5_RHISA|nr:hypothetical protein HPB52_001968 [Rhipicephalus sanguineus]
MCETADSFMEAQALSNLNKEHAHKETGPSELAKKSEAARKAGKPANRCFLCDKTGHRAADCWSRTKGNTPGRCGKCYRTGHSSEYCNRQFHKNQASCVLSEEGKNPTSQQLKDGYVTLQDGETIPIVTATSSRPVTPGNVVNVPVMKGFLEKRQEKPAMESGDVAASQEKTAVEEVENMAQENILIGGLDPEKTAVVGAGRTKVGKDTPLPVMSLPSLRSLFGD